MQFLKGGGMAKITLAKNNNGLTMEANYFGPGLISTVVGGAMMAPAVMGIEIRLNLGGIISFGGLIDMLLPIVIPLIGAIFLFGGLMALGTAQVITFNKSKKTIAYDSTIAFFGGSSKTHTTDDLDGINYNLHKVHHQSSNYARGVGSNRNMMATSKIDTHTTWNSTISLWYKNQNNVELAKISHSESLEEGLKIIAQELGVKYERHVREENQDGFL